MNPKLKAAIAVVIALCLFAVGFEFGIFYEKKTGDPDTPTVAAFDPDEWTAKPTASTTAPTEPTATEPTESTTQPTDPAPSALPSQTPGSDVFTTYPLDDALTTYPADQITAAPTEPAAPATTVPTTQRETPTTAGAQLTRREILQRATTAMQALKNERTFRAHKTERTVVNVVDCSVPALTGTINSIINKNLQDGEGYYSFRGGVTTGYDGSGNVIPGEEQVTPMQVIPPTDAVFAANEADVTSATAAQSGGNTVLTLTIAEERTTLAQPVPPHHAQTIGYLDLGALDVSGASITRADMHYPGAIVKITLNADGKVVQLNLHLPMDGSGQASLGLLSGTASFEGSRDSVWEFSYE